MVGVVRRINNIFRDHHDRHKMPEDKAWQFDVHGGCGELCVAKVCDWLEQWYRVIEHKNAADVGPLEVRATDLSHGGLLMHDDDKDERIYILVTGSRENFVIQGWLYGKEGKKPAYWRSDIREPAFIAPQRVLRTPDLNIFKAEIQRWEEANKNEPMPANQLMPYLDEKNRLIIPSIDCLDRYRWWDGGQSIAETLEELRQAKKV